VKLEAIEESRRQLAVATSMQSGGARKVLCKAARVEGISVTDPDPAAL
jgi:hypothetical protein